MDCDPVLYNDVTEILISLKIPPEMSGFEFLREAIIACFVNPEFQNNITTKLYPTLAKTFNTNQMHIERNMRNAIEKSHIFKGMFALNEFCDMLVYVDDATRFSNSEVIFIVVEYIKIRNMKRTFIKQKNEEREID